MVPRPTEVTTMVKHFLLLAGVIGTLLLLPSGGVEAQLLDTSEFLPGIAVLDPFAPDLDPNGVIASARGGAQIHIGTELRTFAFTAKTKDDGVTTGQFQLVNRAS